MSDRVTPDLMVLAPFLNFGPSRWWEFKDLNTGDTSRWECGPSSANRFRLKGRLGTVVIEHDVDAKEIDAEGSSVTQYTLLRSKFGDSVATWGSGLVLPSPWRLQTSVSAASNEGANPATGGPVSLSVKLLRHEPLVLPPGPAFPKGVTLDVIVVEQVVKDVKLGTVLAKSELAFALSLGICAAKGQNFGAQYSLALRAWSGGA
jgi:hypothetical protein